MKKIFLTLFVLLFTLVANAQTFLGRVVDENSQPIAFANVVLLNQADSSFVSGAVTQDDGSFAIGGKSDSAVMMVSSIGYVIKYLNVHAGNIGDIQLKTDVQMLGEVTVKGYRPIVRREEEKTIFVLKHMPKIEALKAMDVVKFAPGVIVSSNGGIQVAGKSAAVFVNKRQISGDELTSYMNMLKASDIEKIEVLQNHGGTYDASIQGGVINIITKRNLVGFSGGADLYASTPECHYYNLTPTANLFFGTNKWNIYGTYSYNQSKSKQYGETINNYLLDNTIHYSESNYFSNQKSHSYRLGAVYNVAKGHSVGVEINGNSAPPTTSHSQNAQLYQASDGNKYDGTSQISYDSHSDYYNIVGSYRWDIDQNNSFLKFLVNYNDKNSSDNNQIETNYEGTSAYDVNESDITLSKGNNISSTLDFRKNYQNGWSLRAGGKFLSSQRSSDLTVSDHLRDTTSTTDWNYQENIYGAYLGTSKTLGNLYLYFSLRAENTDVNGEAESGNKTSKNYTNWFPYFHISYDTKSDTRCSLSYNRTIYRPAFSLMNGYVNRVSDVMYDMGNPELEAELTDVVALSMSHQRHSASLKYRHTNNAITELFEVKDGITYHTNVNYGTVSSLTLDYSYSGNLWKWWQINLYIAGLYNRTPESYNKKELFSALCSWNNRMTWEKVGSLQFGFFYTSPTIAGNSYQKGYSSFDISIERSFCKDALTIQLGINDLFNTSRVSANNKVPTLIYDVYLKNQTRQIWCKLNYNFSTKNKSNRNRIQNDNDIKHRL